MQGSQKIAALGAFFTAVMFVLDIVYYAVILPGAGYNPQGINLDPSKLATSAGVGAFQIGGILSILFALALTFLSVGLDARLRDGSPALLEIGHFAAIASITLFLLVGMEVFLAPPIVTAIDAQNQAAGTAAFQTITLLFNGMDLAAIFAFGALILLASWAALRAKVLPSILNYLGLLVGGTLILAFLIPASALLAPFVAIVWSAWLGIALWREPAPRVAPSMSGT